MTTTLTKKQTDALLVLPRDRMMSVVELADATDTTAQGAARTAASLVRLGFVHRSKASGRVRYSLTDFGCHAQRVAGAFRKDK